MSLDKAIEHGKEKRKQYTGAKAIDLNCRNHGSCDFCKSNRMYQRAKADESTRQKMADFDGYENTADERKSWVDAVDQAIYESEKEMLEGGEAIDADVAFEMLNKKYFEI